MMLTRRGALLGTGAIGATAFLWGCADKAAANPDLKAVIDSITTAMLKDSPEYATSLTVPEALAGGPYKGRVTDMSAAAEAARNQWVASWIKDLEAIKPDSLNPTDKISHAVVLSSTRYAAAAAPMGYGTAGYGSPNPYILSQLTGSYVGMPDFLDSQHVVKTKDDADAWLSRVEGFAGQMGHEVERVNADAAKGAIPPNFIIDRALGQLRSFLKIPVAETVLVSGLVRKAKESGLAADQLGAAATKLVSEKVFPAYQAQIALMEELRAKSTADAGVWKLPQGDAYYQAATGYWTTTKMSPDEIHELGRDLVRSFGSQMDEGLKKLGMTQGSVAERMRALSKDPKYLYPNNDAGKEQLLADLNKQMAVLKGRLPEMFATLAKADCEVKRVPAYTEAGAPGGYYQSPAPDGSRPGAYYINLRDTAAWPKWSLPTLTYHEAQPGHHLQISLAQEAQGLPFLRSKMLWFGAYGEGWALYAEQLADEMGLYENDIAGRLGYAQSAAFRAARLVVDTGLHAKKWTKEQAVDYMLEATGDTRDSIVTEVERYCVWPGQACSYMVGKTNLIRLRTDAKTKLADKFDIKAFHDQVLLPGPLPLDVLDSVIVDWQNSVKT
ncbi:MAG: DUF885 domain-containing protein [Hyphomonadaceae bacterium]